MKNIYKLLIVILAFSLLIAGGIMAASAATIDEEMESFIDVIPESYTAVADAALSEYKYVAYGSEEDFIKDLVLTGEGDSAVYTIDGKDESGNSLLVDAYCGTTDSITLPNSAKTYYIYLLSDVTLKEKLVMSEQGERLFLNLGGKKFNVPSGTQINTGNSGFVKKNNYLAVFNGTVDSKVTSGQTFTPRQNSTVVYRDLDIILAGGSLMQDGGSNIYFENVNVTGSKAVFIYYRQSWEKNACTCGKTPCECSAETQLRNKHIYKNINVTTATAFSFEPGQRVYLDVYLDKDCTINPTTNFFDLPDKNIDKMRASEFYFHFEEGAVINSTYGSLSAEIAPHIKGYDANGEPYGKIVKEDTVVDGVTYAYVVKGAPYKVTWVDSDGESVIAILPYFENEIPNYPINRPGVVSVADDGLPYIYTFAGWSTTKGATTPDDELAEVTADVTYYMVMDNVLASFALYDSEATYKAGGAPINAWTDDSWFTASLFQSFPENAYMILFSDMEYSANARIQYYKSGITIDLNGKTFSKTGTEGQCRFITPLNEGETLTFKNGNIYCKAQNLVYSSHTNGESGMGEVIFENCNITLDSGAMDIRSGHITLKGGTLTATGAIATLGNVSENQKISFNIYGTTVSATSHAFAIVHPANSSSKNVYSQPTINIDSTDKDGKFWARPTVTCLSVATLNSSGVTDINPNSFLTLNIKDSFISNSDVLVRFANDITVFDHDTGNSNGAYSSKDYKGVYTLSNTYVKTLFAPDLFFGKFNYGEGMTLLSVYDDPDMPYFVGKYVNGMKTNLSLSTDFTLNLYIPVDTLIDVIELDGGFLFEKEYAEYDFDVVMVHGVQCYYVPIEKIAPQNAAEALTLTVYFENDDGIGVCYSMLYSVVEYASDILAKSDSQLGTVAKESKALMADTLAYVAAAYANFNSGATESVDYLAQLCAKYPASITAPKADDTAIGTDLAAFVTGASFKLENKIVLKLTLAAQDTPVTVTVNGNEYATESVSGENAVYVYLNAKDIAGVITITSGDAVGTYSLAAYYNSEEIQSASDEVKAVVSAMTIR